MSGITLATFHGREGFRRQVAECLANAEYAVRRLREIGVEAWRNPFAITVVFPRPPASVLEKWQIAVQGDRAHIILMQHVTRAHIDELVEDMAAALKQQRSSPA